jgi:hypothetical protein
MFTQTLAAYLFLKGWQKHNWGDSFGPIQSRRTSSRTRFRLAWVSSSAVEVQTSPLGTHPCRSHPCKCHDHRWRSSGIELIRCHRCATSHYCNRPREHFKNPSNSWIRYLPRLCRFVQWMCLCQYIQLSDKQASRYTYDSLYSGNCCDCSRRSSHIRPPPVVPVFRKSTAYPSACICCLPRLTAKTLQ